MRLWLCGATLVDLDLRPVPRHHPTRRQPVRPRLVQPGRAVFHGDVVFGTAPPDHVVLHGAVA
ncbi:hypothetical protein [Micromonospora craniellae]|uniref:Uncharacterized protein n=1 Tax=Micromonospora craniellae TaxID=2294034 RepID=A0A372G3C9_9ACTN|nr:hypothetical protein [Micromonospora craniellae]QOC92024.1 hypothetical protein ID554_29875 [Micromonospora craniellae]RFS47512.1 hypothetical protein D0Q02_05900 [Micromonospora craniellae]